MLRSLLCTLALAALCSACSSPNPPPLPAPPRGGAAVPGFEPPAQPLATLRCEFDTLTLFNADGKLSGSAGCNRFNAAYRAEGGALAVSARLAAP